MAAGSSADAGTKTAEEIQELARQAEDGVIIFIGNPGTGKSTLVNCYAGKLLFHSNVSVTGAGVTKLLHGVKEGKTVFVDTPGLSDHVLRKQAGEAIEQAFRAGGNAAVNFKLIFVLTTEEGRVKPDDVTTMSLVMEAVNANGTQIGQDDFGIIVNKCEPEWLQLMEQHRDQWCANLMQQMEMDGVPSTKHVHFAARRPDLVTKENKFVQLSRELVEFIKTKTPFTAVQGDNVNDVNTESWKDMQKKAAEHAQEINTLKQEFQQQMDSALAGLKRAREEAEDDRKRARTLQEEANAARQREEELRRKVEEDRQNAADNRSRQRAAEIRQQANRLNNFSSGDKRTFDSVYNFATTLGIANIASLSRNPGVDVPVLGEMVMMEESTWTDLKDAMLQKATELENETQ